MVRVLGLISLLFASTAWAAVQQGPVPQVNIGMSSDSSTSAPSGGTAISINDIFLTANGSGWFTLSGGGSPGNNNFGPFWRSDSNTPYQVPSGYTTKCINIKHMANGSNVAFQLVSATAQFAIGATSLTGGVYQGGASGVLMMLTGATGVQRSEDILYNFTQNTWPGWQELAAATNYYIRLTCKEFQ